MCTYHIRAAPRARNRMDQLKQTATKPQPQLKHCCISKSARGYAFSSQFLWRQPPNERGRHVLRLTGLCRTERSSSRSHMTHTVRCACCRCSSSVRFTGIQGSRSCLFVLLLCCQATLGVRLTEGLVFVHVAEGASGICSLCRYIFSVCRESKDSWRVFIPATPIKPPSPRFKMSVETALWGGVFRRTTERPPPPRKMQVCTNCWARCAVKHRSRSPHHH